MRWDVRLKAFPNKLKRYFLLVGLYQVSEKLPSKLKVLPSDTFLNAVYYFAFAQAGSNFEPIYIFEVIYGLQRAHILLSKVIYGLQRTRILLSKVIYGLKNGPRSEVIYGV